MKEIKELKLFMFGCTVYMGCMITIASATNMYVLTVSIVLLMVILATLVVKL